MPINPISKTKQNSDETIEQQGQKLCERVDDSTLHLSSKIEIKDDKVKIQSKETEDELLYFDRQKYITKIIFFTLLSIWLGCLVTLILAVVKRNSNDGGSGDIDKNYDQPIFEVSDL